MSAAPDIELRNLSTSADNLAISASLTEISSSWSIITSSDGIISSSGICSIPLPLSRLRFHYPNFQLFAEHWQPHQNFQRFPPTPR